MPISDAVWGIDIGQCALKALRCSPHEQEGRLVADAFDFVEYPQILSQAADPSEAAAIVAEAIKTFLSRNNVKGDKIAVSVPGQSGLARYIKIPPVEAKKVPDLVKYEAKQQIPFALEDVIWDYQTMPGSVVEDGFMLDTEVGLFAMKREQVFKALRPFQDAGIEVDIVQLSPVAIYNFVNFDQINEILKKEIGGNKWVVVLSMGTDTTDLVVTNGNKMWQRSIPLGGNHFTKALSKEMKLTFSKAEHLKRNANIAEDRKALYQAMRGVFNDLVTEVHRSLSFFCNLEKEAEIKSVLALGNTLKLPGLQSFLAKSLEYPVMGLESFRNLGGPAIVSAPAFRDNLLAYGVCYGLCIQGENESKIHTNLLPKEIVSERIIRAKKPWAVAAAAALLLGCGVNFFGHERAFETVLPDKYKPAFSKADQVATKSSGFVAEQTEKENQVKATEKVGAALAIPARNRDVWIEMVKAINQALPQAVPGSKSGLDTDLADREVIYVDSLDCAKFGKLEEWYAGVKGEFKSKKPAAPAAEQTPAVEPVGDAKPPEGDPVPDADGPKGEGWVIQFKAHHFHNNDGFKFGRQYVRATMLDALENEKKKVQVPQVLNGKLTDTPVLLTFKELGISFPVMFDDGGELIEVDHPEDVQNDANPNNQGVGGPRSGPRGGAGVNPRLGPAGLPAANNPAAGAPAVIRKIKRYDFTLQLVWVPTPAAKRIELKTKPQTTTTAASEKSASGGGE